MFRHAVRFAKASGAAAGAALVLSATAHADEADDNYLHLLALHGVRGDTGVLITAGRGACDALKLGRFGYGMSPYQVAMTDIMAQLAGQGLSRWERVQVISDGQSTYCPNEAL